MDAAGGGSGNRHGLERPARGRAREPRAAPPSRTAACTDLELEVSADETCHHPAPVAPIDVPAHAQYRRWLRRRTAVVWTVDDTRIGSIDDNGVFERLNGVTTAGSVTITGRAGSTELPSVTLHTVTVAYHGESRTASATRIRRSSSARRHGRGKKASWPRIRRSALLVPVRQHHIPAKARCAPVLQFGGRRRECSTYLKITSPGLLVCGVRGRRQRTDARHAVRRRMARFDRERRRGEQPVKVQVSKATVGTAS